MHVMQSHDSIEACAPIPQQPPIESCARAAIAAGWLQTSKQQLKELNINKVC